MSQIKSLALVMIIAVAITVTAIFISLPSESNQPTMAQDNQESSETTRFTSERTIRDIVYTAKFECGTISGAEGPLRPGHYDTSIGILNKQDFPVQFTWTVVVNDSRPTHPVLKTLQPQTSAGIVCNDLRQLVGNEKFVGGFVIIEVPASGQLFAGSTSVVGRQGDIIDILDVQVFYTANALLELPHEVLVDKIVFSIEADSSGKVPQDMIGKMLDVTLLSDLGQISDPVEKVRNAIATRFGLSSPEANNLEIKIEMVSVGVGTMIDDHALSLSRAPPQIRED